MLVLIVVPFESEDEDANDDGYFVRIASGACDLWLECASTFLILYFRGKRQANAALV